MTNAPNHQAADIILVGAGIMSATLGTFLKELNPKLRIEAYEILEDAGLESSNAWNNAGTGHAANCELNYTPEQSDGTIDISKALEVNVEFDLSRQFWAYLVKKGCITDPKSFIHSVPHMSFVRGEPNVAFLRKRFTSMQKSHCYRGMEYTEDKHKLKEWIPLVMEGRDPKENVAATRMISGTDVDYGSLTRSLMKYLQKLENFNLHYSSKVIDIKKESNGLWNLKIQDLKTSTTKTVTSKFVFLGAGGGSLALLQKSAIPEIRGYAGFPVSGIWLRCDNPQISSLHHAKVYGKASVGSPPMSVPHLDTRIVEKKKSILFGPYAGFSTKFLKHGSLLDFFHSIRLSNISSLLSVARHNLPLTKYLIEQVFQSAHHRFETLQAFYPKARKEDWRLEVAGQRVQVIRPHPDREATLEFGTELIMAADRSLVGLLGASPGASTAVFIAISLLEKCFPDNVHKLKQIIPSYGESIVDDAQLCQRVRSETASVLLLENG